MPIVPRNLSKGRALDGDWIFNSNQAAQGLQIKGTTNANMLRVDATNNRVGIGKAPGVAFDVSGVAAFDNNMTVAGTLTVTGTLTASGTLAITGATTQTGLLTANGGLTLGAGSNLTSDTGTAAATTGAATLNKQSGTITSEALTTAAAGTYTLTLTNSVIAATSRVFVSADNGTNSQGELTVQRVTPSAGQVIILVKNTHATQAYNGTIKINFFAVL